MKIVIFSSFFPLIKGGAEFQSRLFSDFLTTKDIEVVYISNNHEVEEEVFLDGYKVYKLGKLTKWDTISLNKSFSKRIINILEKESPDVIYQRVLNSFSFYLSNYASKNNVQMFLHIADNYSLDFTNRTIRTFVRFVFFKRIIKNGTFFFTQTSLQNRELDKYNVFRKFKIYNFQHLKSVCASNVNEDICRVFWIGSSRSVKRIDLFFDVVKFYREYKNVIFYHIGRLEENGYNSTLYNEIRGLKNFVEIGEVSQDEVEAIISTGDLLINTSLSEGFSNTFISAWSLGVNVYSLNSDPDGLLVNNKFLGKYFGNDFNAFLDSIGQFIANEVGDENENLNRCKRIEFCKKNFDVNFNCNEMLQVINSRCED